MPARKTQEQVIDEFKKVHGDKYDYSKVEYKDTHNKVCIICHEKDENGIEHGEFWQEPNSHLSGRGCRKCAYINFNNPLKIDTQKCIELSIKKHGNRYDYVKTVCSKSSDIIIVTCKKHGDGLIILYKNKIIIITINITTKINLLLFFIILTPMIIISYY